MSDADVVETGSFLGAKGLKHLVMAPGPAIRDGPHCRLVSSPVLQKTVALDVEGKQLGCLHAMPNSSSDAEALTRFSSRAIQIDDLAGEPDTRARLEQRFGLTAFSNRTGPKWQVLEKTIRQTPVPVFDRPDGARVVLDDVDIACAAQLWNLPLRIHVLSTEDAMMRLARLPDEFFGTMRGGIPYQSIFFDGTELVRGRRPDLYERFAMVYPEDLKGRRVLDLGCNIGMNCYLAIEHGASEALGIDLAAYANAARRLNPFFDAPCQFLAHDLNEGLDGLRNYDTVFVFALIGHLQSARGVKSLILSVEAKTVYLETHCEVQNQGETGAFLRSELFEEVTFLGHTFDNIVSQLRTRQLFRCTTHPSSWALTVTV